MNETPADRSGDGARVYDLGAYRKEREAPLQAAKDRHPAFRERKRREEEQNKNK